MPKKTKADLPSTLARSPAKARRTWEKTHDAAVERYGEGERAHRTAFAALKRGFEKKGDRWVPKSHKGPSDPRSAQPTTRAKREGRGETFGGLDFYGNTKKELYERAKRLGVEGRSRMNKRELARAIAKKQK
ncbi:MAG TPA: ChaB family protein [Sandaracinaceae bacterium]